LGTAQPPAPAREWADVAGAALALAHVSEADGGEAEPGEQAPRSALGTSTAELPRLPGWYMITGTRASAAARGNGASVKETALLPVWRGRIPSRLAREPV